MDVNLRVARRLATAAIALVAVALVYMPGAAVSAALAPVSAYSIAAPKSVAPSGLLARALVPAGAPCPDLVADGRRLRTHIRLAGTTTAGAFSSLVACDRVLPPGTKVATIGGLTIPASMPACVRSMAILGDTGCRLKKGNPVQACSSPASWPTATIARRVANSRPDVILFLGDFTYREMECPVASLRLCAGSPSPIAGMPFKDSAATWLVDTLIPLAPMLRVAPLIIVRGNHELCSRGGNGYLLLFDPRPDTATLCAPTAGPDGSLVPATPPPTNPYVVDLPISAGRTTRLILTDSADGSDAGITAQAPLLRVGYRKANEFARPQRGVEPWLVVHQPSLGIVPVEDVSATSPWGTQDQAAASVGLLSRYRMIMSSHIHLAEAVQVPGQPGQLILGNGGTQLELVPSVTVPTYGQLQNPDSSPSIAGVPPYPPASRVWSDIRFGYTIAHPGAQPGQWNFRLRGVSGDLFATCTLRGRDLTCQNT